MSITALIVEPELTEALALAPMLEGMGLLTLAADTFETARQSMRLRPHLLVSAVQLGEFNGLHLVLHGRTLRPTMAALVTSHAFDAGLQADAESLQAGFIARSASPVEWRAAVERALFRNPHKTYEPIRPPFERRMRERRLLSAQVHSAERRIAGRRRNLSTALADVAGA